MGLEHSPIVMEEVTDPAELAKAQAQDERFARNWVRSYGVIRGLA